MEKLSSNFKVCQNCQYWCGTRDINRISKYIEALSDSGKCINKQGFFNLDKKAREYCSHFEPVI